MTTIYNARYDFSTNKDYYKDYHQSDQNSRKLAVPESSRIILDVGKPLRLRFVLLLWLLLPLPLPLLIFRAL